MGHGLRIFASLSALGAWLTLLPVPSQAQPPEPAPQCGQRGQVVFDKDTALSDASGRKVARFSGGESAVTLLAPPVAGSDLAHILTGSGRGSFRINGFVKASELRIYTSYSVSVVSGHVWLGLGTRVTAAGSSGGRVRIEKRITNPFNQLFTAYADCRALTFTPATPPGFAVPGNARVFLLKEPTLDLYDSVPPTSAPVLTLQRSPLVDNVRFFSTEQRGGFVHVRYQGELNIDAWAKASDLAPLPRGETSDVAPSSLFVTSPPHLQLSETPRVVHVSHELALRVAPKDAEAPIGVIEPDTDAYVMDTVAGWAKVLPKSLHVLPFGDLSFWVKASELAPSR